MSTSRLFKGALPHQPTSAPADLNEVTNRNFASRRAKRLKRHTENEGKHACPSLLPRHSHLFGQMLTFFPFE